MGSDLTELSKEELIKHIETLYHNNDIDYKDKCENYIHKDKIKEILDKAECIDYYTLVDVIEDLEELLK